MSSKKRGGFWRDARRRRHGSYERGKLGKDIYERISRRRRFRSKERSVVVSQLDST